MYLYIYVHFYINIYICIYMYIYTYTYAYIYIQSFLDELSTTIYIIHDKQNSEADKSSDEMNIKVVSNCTMNHNDDDDVYLRLKHGKGFHNLNNIST
jgi:hypothetical protein